MFEMCFALDDCAWQWLQYHVTYLLFIYPWLVYYMHLYVKSYPLSALGATRQNQDATVIFTLPIYSYVLTADKLYTCILLCTWHVAIGAISHYMFLS